MTIKLAIIDDEAPTRAHIASLVTAWSNARGHTTEICEYPAAESFLFEHAEDDSFDILLLDIEMGRINGVELASAIRKRNTTVQIVFITGYSDYIADGYDVAALHYLMKPLSREKFESVLDRAAEKLRQNERFITITTPDAVVRVPLHSIRYIDVCKNYVTVHADEDYTVKRTLGEMEDGLDSRFHRAGRALIVNLSYIIKVTKTDVYLSDKTVLPIPRGAYDALNRAIINAN